MSRPNILLIVWDSARIDYVQEYASTFQSLAKSNLSFTHAVAPATWSLPSHVSFLSGSYPHEHGCFLMDNHYVDALPTLANLQTEGYRCVGVSGNGFASPSKNFDKAFDEFYYTPSDIPFDDGLAVEAIGNHLQNEGQQKRDVALSLFLRSLTHRHPLKSLVNYMKLTCWYLSKQYNIISRLPTSLFESNQKYEPEENTERIIKTIERHEGTEDPFFLFANYMDCHWPYDPPSRIRERHTDINQKEVDRINNEVAKPWNFVDHIEGNKKLNKSDIDRIRELYAGEIESVDEHLQRIINALENRGLREDTLVVITADHGEALGEIDGRGRQRMGHEGSISDHLLRVPLVIANPALGGHTVDNWISLKNLNRLFTEGRSRLLSSGGRDYKTILPDRDVVLSEYPAVGGESIYEKFPDIPKKSLADRVDVHTVVGYYQDWKVAVDSTGTEWAWNDGVNAKTASAPDVAIEACRTAVKDLQRFETGTSNISETEKERLEALGYI